MLIHECVECRTLSINRIAADDIPESIMEIFQESLLQGYQVRVKCEQADIVMLNAEDAKNVTAQLFGEYADVPVFEY